MTRISDVRALLLTPVLLVVTACGEGDRFEKAKQQNTIGAYESYLAERPDGKFAREAKQAIDALKKEAAFNKLTRYVASECKQFFEPFREDVARAPSGALLVLQFANVLSLVEASSHAGPELARAVKEFSVVLEGLIRENAKMLDEEKKLNPAAKDYPKHHRELVRAYLDFWTNERDGIYKALDAFVGQALKA